MSRHDVLRVREKGKSLPHYHLSVFGPEVLLEGETVSVPQGADPHMVAMQAAKARAAQEAAPGEISYLTAKTDQGPFSLAVLDGVIIPVEEAERVQREQQRRAAEEEQTHQVEVQPPAPAEPHQEQPHPSEAAQPSEGETKAPAPAQAQQQQQGSHPAPYGPPASAPQPPASPTFAPPGPGAPTQTPPTTWGPPPEAAPVSPSVSEHPFAHTFIEKHRVEHTPQPQPVGGFAGILAQFGIGGPSSAQQAEDADRLAVSRVWTRPKGIAVANGKGGSGKTPTSLYLAAMFARFGGGMVLVDDNNTFRGAAGWQTENATHGATKEDLLAALPGFDGTERAADMAQFTHHQTTDRYDVLQSRPQKLAKDQALDDEQFDAIQELLRRFYRVVVFDSGNDESAPNWLRMIHHSDALVVPTATTPKHCESAKLLLEALTAQGGHSAELARNAVIVVSHASTNDPAPEQVAPRFAGMAREVLTIPHDPAMAKEWLRWDDLAPKTQRAWLAVGAAIARNLED